MFFTADHLIEKMNIFNKAINKNKSNLTNQNIFIFGIKPTAPSSEYGYFLTKKIKANINKVTKFIEKPKEVKAKQIIKKKGYWNSGMFFLRKDSIINNFKKNQPIIYKNCVEAVKKAKLKDNTYYLNKASFEKATAKSFDYAILEKTKQINAIKLDIPWSDLGSWKEILKMYDKNKNKYIKKKNVFYRPWGRYTNLFEGKEFLIKELFVKTKGTLSLQKHHHRAEYWLVTQGNPKITLNKDSFTKKPNEHIFIPNRSMPIVLRHNNPTLHLIQRLRNEAHRFALNYHRKLRRLALKKSVLTQIPMVGEKRKQALLSHFGSIEQIRKASIDDLLSISQIDLKVAENIYHYFQEPKA